MSSETQNKPNQLMGNIEDIYFSNKNSLPGSQLLFLAVEKLLEDDSGKAIEIIETLLEKNAEPRLTDQNGDTILHYSVKKLIEKNNAYFSSYVERLKELLTALEKRYEKNAPKGFGKIKVGELARLANNEGKTVVDLINDSQLQTLKKTELLRCFEKYTTASTLHEGNLFSPNNQVAIYRAAKDSPSNREPALPPISWRTLIFFILFGLIIFGIIGGGVGYFASEAVLELPAWPGALIFAGMAALLGGTAGGFSSIFLPRNTSGYQTLKQEEDIEKGDSGSEIEDEKADMRDENDQSLRQIPQGDKTQKPPNNNNSNGKDNKGYSSASEDEDEQNTPHSYVNEQISNRDESEEKKNPEKEDTIDEEEIEDADPSKKSNATTNSSNPGGGAADSMGNYGIFSSSTSPSNTTPNNTDLPTTPQYNNTIQNN